MDRPGGRYCDLHAIGVAGAAERAGNHATDASDGDDDGGYATTYAPGLLRVFGGGRGVMGSTQPVNALVRITNLGK